MIKIKNLVKVYNDQKIIDNISFEVKKGEIHGLIGTSGIGKSTILRNISFLEKYDGGKIYIDGEDISLLRGGNLRKYRKNIGLVFQNFSLLERLNVYENISLPLKVWKYPKNKIERIVNKLLKTLSLEEKKYQLPRELSGGQKQRVAVARALSLSPKVLLCDEATSALDPKMTKDISNVLLDINKRLGITILVVSHDLDMIKDICDSVSILKNKNTIITESTDKLFLEGSSEIDMILGKENKSKENIIRIIYKYENINDLENMIKKTNNKINIIDVNKTSLVGGDYFIVDIEKDHNHGEIIDYLNKKDIRFLVKKVVC